MNIKEWIKGREKKDLQYLLTGLSFVCLTLPLVTCSPGIEQRFASGADITLKDALTEATDSNIVRATITGPCNDPADYIPDTSYLDHFPIKYLRINFHFINTTDSTHNYVGQDARRKVREVLSAAKKYVENNEKMWLPPNNDTPVIPTRYRYVLTGRPGNPDDDGIYFHYDDELAYYVHKGVNRNHYDQRVIKKYGVQLDTVLNIFLMSHHPDSVTSPTYNPGRVGVALGTSLKVAGLHSSKEPGWTFSGVLNHEVGHVLGLNHTWAYNDGCDDTPKHPNCWNRSDTPPCDTMLSNNLMDYTAFQRVWSPCQIGRIHSRLARERDKVRALLDPRWCTLHPERSISIKEDIVWAGAKDLEGHLTIEEGGHLTVKCRLSLPEGGKITVKPGGSLILDGARLHNACGAQWQGIELISEGKRKGEVIVIGAPQLEDMQHEIRL